LKPEKSGLELDQKFYQILFKKSLNQNRTGVLPNQKKERQSSKGGLEALLKNKEVPDNNSNPVRNLLMRI
jgi:hypothetical protein